MANMYNIDTPSDALRREEQAVVDKLVADHQRRMAEALAAVRSEHARKAASSAPDNSWVPEAMQYYKDRVDSIEKLVLNVKESLSVMSLTLERIEDALASRSEAIEPNTYGDVPFMNKEPHDNVLPCDDKKGWSINTPKPPRLPEGW